MYDEVMIADYDGTDGHHQKAAHYYPIIQRTSIRPTRSKNINKNRMTSVSEEEVLREVDYVHLQIEEPDEDIVAVRRLFREDPLGTLEEEESSEEQSPVAERNDESEAEKSD